MRSIFMVLVSVSLLLIPCMGCAGSKPDPRDNPDFVDDTDPGVTADMLGSEDTGPGAAGQPAEKPAESP